MEKKTEVKTVAVVEQPIKKPEANPNNDIGIACVIGIAVVIIGLALYKKYGKES